MNKAFSLKPFFSDNAKRCFDDDKEQFNFDKRIDSLGFKRSPTQLHTKADGDCALHGW